MIRCTKCNERVVGLWPRGLCYTCYRAEREPVREPEWARRAREGRLPPKVLA